ncbi:hypothetical protein DITRI_Ditri06bG0165600 [Diplodiscus trichospermus]
MRAVLILFAFLLVIAAICVSFCEGNRNVHCIETDRQALLKFKQDLIDQSNRLSSWVDGEDCCEWIGVSCNNLTGHVNELHLGLISSPPDDDAPDAEWDAYYRSQLQGKINPSLLELKHLNFLDLSNNGFVGVRIPEFIGSLKCLTYLNLSRAEFSGAIPHKLGNLSKLHYLDLGHNFDLEAKTLQWVSGLSSLQYLDLSETDLSNATDWLQVTNELPSLVELHLSECHLNNDPSPTFSVNYTSLAVLDLSRNMLPSVPTWIFSLGSLVSIDLSYDRVEGVIPNGFQNFSSLKFLDLSSNLFSPSSIPSWLSNLNQLEFLGLRDVSLQGNFSSVIGNMSSLTHLDVSVNQLEIVPKCLENVCNLREMDLSYNGIDHEVSEIIESLSKCSVDRLESLNVAFNKLSGHLTDKLGQFKNLTILRLFGNFISGPIPFSIGKLSLLKILDVSNNRLNATLPQSLGQLGNLEYLDVSNNMLEGNISEMHFSNLMRLRILSASNNMLTFKPNPSWIPPFHCDTIYLGNWHLGPQFPQWLRFQKNLSSLDISHAGISGVIPNWFWNLSTRFGYLYFSNNQFMGRISYLAVTAISIDLSSNQFAGLLPQALSNLESLFLSKNLFSGSLSNFLCNSSNQLGYLSILDIESNLLSGEIPNCWKNLESLEVLNLGNNNLSRIIPRSMGSMRNIVLLNLRNNGLFGEVPSALQYLTNVIILDLSQNQLTGSIPTWIGDKLSNLLVLNLHSNNFQGQIPYQWCALNSLQVLDLGYNNISGVIPKCFSILSSMAIKNKTSNFVAMRSPGGSLYFLSALLATKGRDDEFSTTLGLVTSIDLSANCLTSEIPKELGNLTGLQSLNLSGNLLTGKIPESIGNMKFLESLDLSMNQLHGKIPSSFSDLNFLNHLNLSYNNLAGQIPSSTQLQSFDKFSYYGNHLCGPPVTKNCSTNSETHDVPNC